MNKRWVLVFTMKDGNVGLVEPAQGRYTYDTSDEAYAVLKAIHTNNPPERIASIWGDQSIGTFGVRYVECWPGHNDPVAVIYGAETE